MPLLVAHQVLIAAAIGLAAIFSARGALLFSRGQGTVHLGMAIGAAIIGTLLIGYLRTVRAKWLASKRGSRS
jgi:uncharacterized sodium:solute symporter family permease YidK